MLIKKSFLRSISSGWRSRRLVGSMLCCGLVAGCATSHPLAYQQLSSSAQLAANPSEQDSHVPFIYSSLPADWRGHTQIFLEPVVIYDGPDNQLGSVSNADRAALATYMQAQFAEKLRTKYQLVPGPGPGILRIHLTLTGIQTSIPVLSTLTKVAPVGIVINGVKSAADKPASFTGSVSFAVEIYESSSNRLLRAYIAKQYPFAENIATSFGPLDAAKAGVRNGADGLLAELQ